MKKYGWYNGAVKMAKDGVFNSPDCTPLESVEKTPLHLCLTYLAQQNAEIIAQT